MSTIDSSIASKLIKSKIKQVVLCAKCNKFPLYTLDPQNPETVNEYCPICKTSRQLNIKDLSDYMILKDKDPEHDCQQPDHSGTKAESFCANCEKWLCQKCKVIHQNEHHDLIATSIVSEKCLEHNQKYELYCLECQLNLCKTCTEKHESHKDQLVTIGGLLDLKNILIYINHRKSIQKQIQQVGLIYNEIMKQLDDYKKNISEAYTKTNNLNNQILELYDVFLGLAGIFKHNYNVLYNIKDFCSFSFKSFKYDNFKDFNFSQLTVKDLTEFKNYLDKSYFIVQTSNNDFEGLQKITSVKSENLFISCSSYYKNAITEFIVIGFNDGSISLMDINDPTKKLFHIKNVEQYKHNAPILCFLVDGDDIYSGSVDCSIKKWKVNKKVASYELIFEGNFYGHSDDVNTIIKYPNQDKIISCSSDGSVLIWDINFTQNQQEKEKEKQIMFEDCVISITHIPNTNYLVIATVDDNLCLYDLDGEKTLFTLEDIVCNYPGCLKVRENNIIVGGGNCIKVIKLEEQTLKEEKIVNFGETKFNSLQLTQDMINIIPEGENDILFTNARNRIYKYSLKSDDIKVKDIEKDGKIEGFSKLGINKYAIVFGKSLEIMST